MKQLKIKPGFKPPKGYKQLNKRSGLVKKGDLVRYKENKWGWIAAFGLIGDDIANSMANGWTVCRKTLS